jgi:hypothetical protein
MNGSRRALVASLLLAGVLTGCSSPGGGGGGIYFPPLDGSGVGDLGGGDVAVGVPDSGVPGQDVITNDDRGSQPDSNPEDVSNPEDTSTPEDTSSGTCVAGQTRCNGSNIEVCAPGGLSWNFIASCPGGQSCFAGACCSPLCGDHDCGPDGCGGSCGTCSVGFSCQQGFCECKGSCTGKQCGDDGCGNACGECDDGEACVNDKCVCQPDCGGAECGPNGCGGSCGTCGGGEACVEGTCECVPDCQGKVCGSDGCGSSCGTCAAGKTCTNEGACVTPAVCGNTKCEAGETEASCPADCTVPKCSPNQCGGVGTGGCYCDNSCKSSGDCCANVCDVCTSLTHCEAPCVPQCAGKSCGADGCGGTCGSCPVGQSCKANGTCGACTPSCSGKVCGDNGCGGSCGSCPSGEVCSAGACTTALDCQAICATQCVGDLLCELGCPLAALATPAQLECLEKAPCNFFGCILQSP